MEKLRIGEALEKSWSAFEQRGWYLFGLTLAVILIAALCASDAVTTALGAIIFGGYLTVLLKHARTEPIVFDDLFDIDRRWIYYAFGGLLKTLVFVPGAMYLGVIWAPALDLAFITKLELTLFGGLLFFAPALYYSICWMFSGLYIIDHQMRPIEALRASTNLTAGYRAKLFLYFLITVLFVCIGLLFLVVGVFVAIAVINLATIFLFWKLQELQYLNSLRESGE